MHEAPTTVRSLAFFRHMRIIDAKWTARINILVILCPCKETILHRADRWLVRCKCGRQGLLRDIRERYVSENDVNDS